MINPETQHFTAEPMDAHARTRPVDHTPMVTGPADVVDIILDAIRDVAATTWRVAEPIHQPDGHGAADRHGTRLESS